MTARDVVKQWKPDLRSLGFALRGSVFRWNAAENDQYLFFDIAVQRNRNEETFKVNTMILAQNPLASGPEQVVLMGNIRSDGVYLHISRDSWWRQPDLPRALEVLKTHAILWFKKHGNPEYLARVIEDAIEKKSDLTHVLEPLDESMTALPWRPKRTPVVAPRLYEWAALLHYLSKNRERAIERTNDWLSSLPSDHRDRDLAAAQLRALTCPA